MSSGYWPRLVHPIDSVLMHWAAVVASDEEEQAIRNGRPLVLSGNRGTDSAPVQSRFNNYCRAYTSDGSFLSVLHFNSETNQWQPEKVFQSCSS